MTVREHSGRWAPWLGAVLAGLAIAEVVTACVLSIIIGWSWRDALEAFVVTNSLMGVAFAGCGGILTWHRPRNPIGWLFVAAGLAHATTAVCAPALQLLIDAGAPLTAQRLMLTVFAWSWPWSIGLCLPLALLLFPDGRTPSPRWRWVVVAVIVTAPLFALEMGASPEPMDAGLLVGYLTVAGYNALQPLWTATEIRGLLALCAGLAALTVRYRRGSDVERRQLLWLMLPVLVALIVILPWGLVAGTPVEVLFAIP
jgi:two-component system, NarL family, sensor kinase